MSRHAGRCRGRSWLRVGEDCGWQCVLGLRKPPVALQLVRDLRRLALLRPMAVRWLMRLLPMWRLTRHFLCMCARQQGRQQHVVPEVVSHRRSCLVRRRWQPPAEGNLIAWALADGSAALIILFIARCDALLVVRLPGVAARLEGHLSLPRVTVLSFGCMFEALL